MYVDDTTSSLMTCRERWENSEIHVSSYPIDKIIGTVIPFDDICSHLKFQLEIDIFDQFVTSSAQRKNTSKIDNVITRWKMSASI